MGKSRMMGAGLSCSILYGSNVNLKTCGGNKKQGLPFSIDTSVQNNKHVKINAIGNNRDVVFSMNQLGGVSSSSFSSSHAYASSNGYSYTAPFICSPYCVTNLNNKSVSPTIPNHINATLTTHKMNIFSYSVDQGVPHFYTDVSKLSLSDLNHFKVGDVTLKEYLESLYGITTNYSDLIHELYTALQSEDMNNANPLLKQDRVTKKYYSTTTTGFRFGTSICCQLFQAIYLKYPEKINLCPTITSIFSTGDEFGFTGSFVLNGLTTYLNFYITII
jgi:hypothetical protein